MEWLNYHHLLYFWRVVQTGSVTAAAAQLRLSHSTLSIQLRQLEGFLGAPLFERRGRRSVPTPFGQEMASYASEIFRMGQELVDVARLRTEPGRATLRIGIVSALPKTLVHALLAPALDVRTQRLTCFQQDRFDRLVEELAAGRLHLVLANEPGPAPSAYRVHPHLLGESEILLYGEAKLARRLRRGFPASLSGAPWILPPAGVALRRSVDQWLLERGIVPKVVAEVEDAGLTRALGVAGLGVFPVRSAIKAEVDDLHGPLPIGPLAGVRERYVVLSAERVVRQPALLALLARGRAQLRASSEAGGGRTPGGGARSRGPRRPRR